MFKRASVLFFLAAALLGKGENDPFFSLSSSETFATNGKPRISMTALHVDSLEFRVYRVGDPLKFFTQLDDPHEFGRSTPRPARERTLLEKLRNWKRGVRREIRRELRAQFDEPPSLHTTAFRAKPAAPAPVSRSKGSTFPEVPLLNTQQLVLSFTQPVLSKDRWQSETVDIGVAEPGVYVVEAVTKELRAYTILMVSDLAMITKSAGSRIVNVVVDRATGQPVPAVIVTSLSRRGEIARAETNGDGVAELPPAGAQDEQITVLARRGRDVALATVSGGAYGPSADQWQGYIYTDRPVYRPGHTTHFKGIFRLRTATGFTVPAGRKVSFEIHDPDQKPVYQKTLTISPNGGVHDDLNLAPNAALGTYFMQVKSGEAFMSGSFEVEEYKKPEYQVTVTASKARVLQGETVPVTIEAKYFFGEPVAGAKVKYSIHRSPYWFPLWYDPEDDEDSQRYQDFDDDGDQLSDQDAQLDQDGKLTVNVPTSESDRKQDFRYRLEVKVTDAAQREISGTGWVTATYGSFLLNVSPDRYVVAPGSRASFGVEARDYENEPVRSRSHVELVSVHYRRNQNPSFETIAGVDVELDSAEPKKVEFTIPEQGGSYEVRASAKTPGGRTVTASTYVYVYGGGANFGSTEGDAVKIVADRKTYKDGETARLMIVAGKVNTPVFITVEGRDLREYKVVRSKDATVSFELPISATEEPGITVNAAFIRDGAFHNGTKYIRVPPVEHALNVKLETSKPQYKPGDTASYNFEVTDAAGKAVPRAEFSLGVVDEAIYSIRKESSPAILSFFFGREYSRVSTESSLQYYFSGQAGKKRMQLAALRPRSRLAQLKPESLIQPKVRKLFPDTALWVADLTTDERGRAHANVVFPDSLTTWRATARGITPDTRVGSATLRTIVRKNLILRLVTPRFLVQGDEVVLSAIVHNYLTETKSARVSLDMEGLDVVDGAPRDVSIPSRGEVKVSWRVRAQQVRRVKITGKALTNEESDALELEIPVNIPGVRLSQSKGGSLATGSAEFELTYPERVERSRSLAIRVSSSIVGSLLASVEYLTAFPYGCVEQTMSSFLPNIIVRDAVSTLGLKVDLDTAALQEKIRAGLDRLYSFQHGDGGWGWWETDDTHPFMTAYVVAGLVQARGNGTEVRQDAVDKGVGWLKKSLADKSKLDLNLRAYMIYALALAGQPDTARLSELYDQRSKLSAYGQALLGLTLEHLKDGRATEIATLLEGRVEQDMEQAWWTATRDPMLDFDGDVTPEATAYVVKFLSHQRKDSPLLPKAALWLMNHRNEGYWWSSTKQTAMVIYGLTDYLKVTNELSPKLNVTVYVNDIAVLTRRIEQVDLNPPDLVLDESKLKPGANRVRVTTSGEGRLYYSARAEYYSRDPQLQRNGTVSLNILRNYFRLVPVKKGERITWDTAPLQGPVTPGDVIAVQLTVTGSDWKYLLLEDPIPAGTEFIERDNLYELNQKPAWWNYSYSRRELHDDRMAIFQTYFGQGQQQYFYLLKVVNGGLFDVSPARVAPMYQQGVMATTDARRLEVK